MDVIYLLALLGCWILGLLGHETEGWVLTTVACVAFWCWVGLAGNPRLSHTPSHWKSSWWVGAGVFILLVATGPLSQHQIWPGSLSMFGAGVILAYFNTICLVTGEAKYSQPGRFSTWSAYRGTEPLKYWLLVILFALLSWILLCGSVWALGARN